MSKSKKDFEIAKAIKRAARQQRLEEEAQYGRKHSKVFGGKPSEKEERRKNKLSLRKMVDLDNYDSED